MKAKYWKGLSQALRNPAYVCFIWFGMTAGISLLATPVRFTAPLITRPVALDVGRVVFAALNKAELIALLILLLVVRVSGRARELWAQCSALILILLVQSVWLLPELAARSQQIVAGVEPAPSMLHGTYSVLELSKLLLLLYLGFRSLQATEPARTLQDQ
ncbi:MAG: hypothetical protein V3R35_00050 [Woeseiaceae bacterium]